MPRRNLLHGASAAIAVSLAGPLFSTWDSPAEARAATAPQSAKNYGCDPEHIFIPKPVPDSVTIVTEPVMGSDFPMQMIYVEGVPCGLPG